MTVQSTAHMLGQAVRRVRQVACFLWWLRPVRLLRRLALLLLLSYLMLLAFGAGLMFVSDEFGPQTAEAAWWSLPALAVLILLRRPLRRVIRSMWLKRRFQQAVVDAKLITERNKIPAAYRVREVAAGDQLLVVVPRGGRVTDLEGAAESIAVSMRARQVRITRRPEDARLADVLVVRRDPLVELAALPWPWRALQNQTLWAPVPVGVDENGGVVEMALPEHNLLLGGEPGAGKSAALSQLVAAAALDPQTYLWLLDGKLVELAVWRDAANANIGTEVDEAIDLLREVQRQMDARYAELLEQQARKIHPLSGHALHVVVCDELAHYLSAGDRRQTAAFTEVLRDLVSRGRAAGVIVLAATQKPSSDVVPTSIRDLFGYRWAFRCASPHASDTILGQGWASQGYNAATIDPALRGVGWLLHEGGIPIRLRAYYLDDATLADIAQRAARLRADTASAEPGGVR
ncbi:MAG: FtsK/SpoIIIE domain-containing protein [Actinomycetota bacterium]|nr:FtsK/SpoIIIE domain-containing protein [Actinomycetota bacterium]